MQILWRFTQGREQPLTWDSFRNFGTTIIKQRPILFCGSGLSISAGYPSANDLSCKIKNGLKNEGLSPPNSITDLAEIAQYAMLKNKDPNKIASYAFGKADPPEERHPWYTLKEMIERSQNHPSTIIISHPHLVIARLAREGLISEIVTTNYDSSLEHALWAVGMDPIPNEKDLKLLPRACKQYFQVLNKNTYKSRTLHPSVFHIAKIHGSIDDALKENPSNPETYSWEEANTLVIAFQDLVSWNMSDWAKSYFEDRVKSRNIIIAGFSGSDPYLSASSL
jgi:hypothetical protein